MASAFRIVKLKRIGTVFLMGVNIANVYGKDITVHTQ